MESPSFSMITFDLSGLKMSMSKSLRFWNPVSRKINKMGLYITIKQ